MIRDTSAQDTQLTAAAERRVRHWVVAGIVVLALAAAAATLLSGWQASTTSVSASRVRIAAVTRGTLVRDAAVNGRVVAAVSPTLYSPSAATVNLKVNAGDKVRQGDVLAVLESPDLADALKREQSSYEELQAEVARQQIIAKKQKLAARRDADQAEIERVAAQRLLERVEGAGVVGVIAKNDFEKAQDTLKSAEIRSKHASAAALLENNDVDLQLQTRLSQLQRQKLALDLARRRVDDLTLRAPLDGVVGSLAVVNRTVVPANAPLMTLVDLSRLEVELEIPETYAADLGLGMGAEITAGEAKALGKLSALSPEVVKNQVLARVRFTGTQPAGLRQSQRVTARLLIDEKPGVLLLPRGSFADGHGAHFVYVVEDGFASRRTVQLGATSVSQVEVTGGLKTGDKVVVAGAETFDNAERVKIND